MDDLVNTPLDAPQTGRKPPRFHWDLQLDRDSYNGKVLSWISQNLPNWKRQGLDAITTFWGPFALRDLEQQEGSPVREITARAEAALAIQQLQRRIWLICETFDLPLNVLSLTPLPTSNGMKPSGPDAVPTDLAAVPAPVEQPVIEEAPLPGSDPVPAEPATAAAPNPTNGSGPDTETLLKLSTSPAGLLLALLLKGAHDE